MAEAVRLVVWDLDETFWKGTVTEGGIREYVQANHDIVIELARRGIMSSICSKNDRDTILPILEQKGILEYFIFPSISWDPKGPRLARLIETVQLRAPTVMFIDDNANNRAEATAIVKGLQVEDENFIPGILSDPRFNGKDDQELARLAQYKLLERRKRDEEEVVGGNQEFLRSCDIRVYIEYDVETHIERAIELINRTNQLNYTKRRLSEDAETARRQFRDLMKPFDRVAGLVKVVDKYGDYGFVGFFMTGGMRRTFNEGAANTHLVHFCFSCRTLGMFVEQWVYQYLDRPELIVSGDVLTDLSISRNINWIRLVDSLDDFSCVQKKIAPQIILYGGCEMNVLAVFMQKHTDRLDVRGNYVSNDIFVNVNYAEHMIDVWDRDLSHISKELELLGLPLHLETGDLFRTAAHGTLFVLNASGDAHGGNRLRHKINDWTFVLSPNNMGGGVRLPLPETELIARISCSKKSIGIEEHNHCLRVNRHLLENYEVVGTPEEADLVDEIRLILSRIPTGSKFILIVDHDEGRDGSEPYAIKPLPSVTRYKSIVSNVIKEASYADVVLLSDLIKGPDEILGSGHYGREVYFRLANRITEVAAELVPRIDQPLSRNRFARLTKAAADKYRRKKEAIELVEYTYECLMKRKADAKSRDFFVAAIAEGRMSQADFLRSITHTNEFKDKWLSKPLQNS